MEFVGILSKISHCDDAFAPSNHFMQSGEANHLLTGVNEGIVGVMFSYTRDGHFVLFGRLLS